MIKKIYLDYAATTPVDPKVLKAMEPYFIKDFGNPASLHWFGQQARQAVEKVRNQVAQFLRCKTNEIVFTSGATESNNLAIKGVVRKFQVSSYKLQDKKPHIITSRIEHHCVLETCKALEKEGVAEVSYVPVNTNGVVELNKIEKAVKDNTILVSVMYANNEIGTVQPIRQIGQLIKSVNKKRASKIIFHTDAVQAVNYLNCQVNYLGVDLLSISGHKIYGPKGVGVSYIKEGTPVSRIQDGGEQEYNLRAGTHNTPGIVGLGAAISLINSKTNIQSLKDKLIDGVLKNVPNAKLNGSRTQRLPNNANFSFPGAEGEAIMMALDLEGIAISTGSACASASLEPSHVLLALGLSDEDAHSSIRVSLGKYTTEAEINQFLKILPKVVGRLRKISGKK